MAARLISTQEAAKLLGITTQSVRNWIEQGYIKGRKVGENFVIDRNSIERFFDSLQDLAQTEKKVKERLDEIHRYERALDEELKDILVAKDSLDNAPRGIYHLIAQFATMNAQYMFSERQQEIFHEMMFYGDTSYVSNKLCIPRGKVHDIFFKCLRKISEVIDLKKDKDRWDELEKENQKLKAQNVSLKQKLAAYKTEKPRLPLKTPEVLLRDKLNMNFACFNFYGRAFNVLKELGCKTLGDVAAVQKSTLQNYPNCGRKTIDDIENELAVHGLTLGMDVKPLLEAAD